MKKEKGLEIIKERVEDFEKNKALIMKKGYGETNIRSNYIDIMFEALGWNIRNKYEVDREFSQKDKSKEANTKKVDYAFKLNGKLKFFIEAKEASVDLEHNKDAIYQAKRYAYSSNGKAPIVILTDFEEFRVFTVLTAPLFDNPDKQLLKSHSFQYTEYVEKWDLIWDTFSKEAVAKGSLDELRGTITKNTKTMDKDFLEQITKWREVLAKNIAIRNEDLSVDDINEAVQRILDRLIFIRNLEDREIEPENTLLNIAKNKTDILKSLVPLFNSLNTTYNGLLFKPHFSEKIIVDDKTLYDVIREMCYPVSPFQFDVIEPEILGRIYEKFLGSKIRLTDSHRAKVEEKLEVRKAGGVYYTPEYIVDYIVKNTVGEKIEGLTPNEIKGIKIVDPACGSGSFLIGAYNYLLEYHRQWYIKNKTNKDYKSDWYKTKEDEIVVNLHKRGDILRNNIFGVDIDKEATEVAIMSLYLKMLDDGFDKGERDLFFVKGSVLPDMSNNIQCGNSLIENDYFDGLLTISDIDLKEINPFTWRNKFENIFTGSNGFDCIIGNPPYIDCRTSDQRTKKYWDSHFISTQYGKTNTYEVFIETALKVSKKDSLIGFIVPTVLLSVESCKSLRQLIFENHYMTNVSYGDYAVFEDANVDTIVIIIKSKNKQNGIVIKNYSEEFKSVMTEHTIDSTVLFESNDFKVSLKNDPITKKIKSTPSLYTNISEIVDFYNGIATGPDKEKYFSQEKKNESYKPLLMGNNIARYLINYDGRFINYDRKKLHRPREENIFLAKEKIIMQRIRNLKLHRRLVCTLDTEKYYTFNSVNNLLIKQGSNYDIRYVLALLNSDLLNYLLKQYSLNTNITQSDLNLLPIRKIDFSAEKEKKIHDNIVVLVNQLIESFNLQKTTKSDSSRNLFTKKIEMIDNNLNQMIYSLYNLGNYEVELISKTN